MSNMTFSFGIFKPLAPADVAWHDRGTCNICKELKRQLWGLEVHVVSRSFQWRKRCGE